ncbi:MAG: N-acetyl sugar amidotransferase [Treponema phagedenis]|uniref:N-acetyl sugar amidotransferase n=1 Tax=Treponema phagedenis TaxID=162 RepID=UPI003133EFCF
MKKYQICTRCVMDNASDDTITFDENGYCNYCSKELARKDMVYFPNEEGKKKLDTMLSEIKKNSKNKPYDCLMGISGGLDSSYLAYLGHKWGLRILAVHVDDSFDTEISKSNIKKLCGACHIDLKIETPDPVQFNDLTAAYIRAGVPNIAIPQDNILFAALYKYARKYRVKYFLSGGNFALESILQRGNTFTAYDVVNIKDIHKKFGRLSINKLKFLSNYRKFFDKVFFRIKTYRPLNYINYNREVALNELYNYCGFEYYGSKHLENTLTKFIQQYWFYERYKVDKRRSHLSSMIVSDQMTREEALEELKKPIYDTSDMELTKKYVLEQLGITAEEFDSILSEPPLQHFDYKIDKITKFVDKIRLQFRLLNLFG